MACGVHRAPQNFIELFIFPCAGNAGVFPLNLYARVRTIYAQFAHETAGAASTRHSLRPLFSRANDFENFGRIAPRECEIVSSRHCLRQTRNVCARERSDEAIYSSVAW